VPLVTNGAETAPLLDSRGWLHAHRRASCRRPATAQLLAKREVLKNRLIAMSPHGDSGDVPVRVELRACAHHADVIGLGHMRKSLIRQGLRREHFRDAIAGD